MCAKQASAYWPEGFAEFWAQYPRHVAKLEAQKAWVQVKPTPELLGRMLEALTWQARQPLWTKDGGQFAPYPASWLRGRRWEDEAPQLRGHVLEDRWLCPHEPWCPNKYACDIVSARTKAIEARS